ncbi:MAG: OmpA family protein [Proteobacteria bacterium]|nr:OmpA family protein [Pseudomonadota bacterium]
MLTGTLLALGCAHAAAPDVGVIQPRKGLVMTSTVINGGFVSVGNGGAHSYSGMDMEQWHSVADSTGEDVTYQIRFSAPGNANADADMKKATFRRRVRREDIAQSLRINWGLSTQDPEVFAGQTYEETSLKALGMLKSGADVPLVIGAIDGDDPSGMGAILKLAGDVASGSGKPQSSPLAGMGAVLQTNFTHTYYRGKFHRVETAPLTLAVLLNGARVNLPVIHAQGTVTSPNDRSLQMQYWWLDSPVWPVALKKSFAYGQKVMTEQVTRIDFPPADASGGGAGGGGGGANMADQLRKSCHVELSGIYFNTGSARLLEESQPALKAIAQVVLQSKEPVLSVEGHTDNVGTAEFNQDLSQKRAAAVRQALIAQFGVPPARLVPKGFGFTRPLESNDTVEGRARNRRVELTCSKPR